MKVEFQHTMKMAGCDVDVTARVIERTGDVTIEKALLVDDKEINLVAVLPTRVMKELAYAALEAAIDLRGQDPNWGDAA